MTVSLSIMFRFRNRISEKDFGFNRCKNRSLQSNVSKSSHRKSCRFTVSPLFSGCSNLEAQSKKKRSETGIYFEIPGCTSIPFPRRGIHNLQHTTKSYISKID